MRSRSGGGHWEPEPFRFRWVLIAAARVGPMWDGPERGLADVDPRQVARVGRRRRSIDFRDPRAGITPSRTRRLIAGRETHGGHRRPASRGPWVSTVNRCQQHSRPDSSGISRAARPQTRLCQEVPCDSWRVDARVRPTFGPPVHFPISSPAHSTTSNVPPRDGPRPPLTPSARMARRIACAARG